MKPVIFDMDGVLIDSEPLWREVEVAILGALGVPIDTAACERTMGLRIDEAIQYWFDRHPWRGPTPQQVAEDVVAGVSAAIRARGEALPGAVEAFRVVQDGPSAIATSSPPPVIEAVLTRLQLAPSVVCSAADEAAGKPDPAVYLTTARRLGVDPTEAIAVEDSPAGVASARAAGMFVVAVQPVQGANVFVPTPQLAAWLATRAR